MCRWVLLVLKVLTLQYAVGSPVRDYVIAYIPIEELAHLTNIETVPITSCEIVLPDDYETEPITIIDETSYCTESYATVGIPIYLRQEYPVYTVYLPIPVYQYITMPTISVLPSVSIPTGFMIRPTMSPSFQTISYSVPTIPSSFEKNDILEELEEVILPAVESVCDTAIATPISGTVSFNGKVPVSGKINIYARCF